MKVSTGSANQGIIIAIRVREHGLKDGVSYQIKDLRWRPTLGHQGRLCICRFHATGLQPRFTDDERGLDIGLIDSTESTYWTRSAEVRRGKSRIEDIPLRACRYAHRFNTRRENAGPSDVVRCMEMVG
jgi:hypothetical protein